MEKMVKLIWDFRGPVARQTAAHFHQHLRDSPFCKPEHQTGLEHPGASHSLVYTIVAHSEIPGLRDALKPHRGEIV